MKRLLFLILLLLASICYAEIDTFEGQAVCSDNNIEGVTTTDTIEGQVITSCASACTTPKDGDIVSAKEDIFFIAYESGSIYAASSFTASSSYTVCKIDAIMYKVGSPTFMLRAAIYDDNGGEPGSLVGTASAELDSSTFDTSDGTVTFTGLDADVTNTVLYWVVAYYSSGPQNFYNDYVKWSYFAAGAGDELFDSADGSSWDSRGTYHTAKFLTYS